MKFEREGLDGIIPVGSYLADAAARFGVRFEEKCVPAEGLHHCKVTVEQGKDVLTELTEAEKKGLSENEKAGGARFACQAKVIEPGEIVVMTKKNEEKPSADKTEEPEDEDLSKKFAELPLEKKIAELVRLEAIALGDTVSFIFNSPYLVFDKAMDVLAEFGMKKEDRARTENRPAEHRVSDNSGHDDKPAEAAQGKNKKGSPEKGTDT